VLLYTYGLIERRDRDLDAGRAQLRDAVSECATLPLEELCDEVLERLVPGGPEDDVALVAIRPASPRSPRPRPGRVGPERVPPTVP
jgi:serine phosphatase RsbU (regulator of sigma subunit)